MRWLFEDTYAFPHPGCSIGSLPVSSITAFSHPGTNSPEIISLPFGKVPNVTLSLAWRDPDGMPDKEEMNIAFKMLDAMLLERPFDQWEH